MNDDVLVGGRVLARAMQEHAITHTLDDATMAGDSSMAFFRQLDNERVVGLTVNR